MTIGSNMKTDVNAPAALLKEMDMLLDDLVSGAEKLLELSQKVIAEEELVNLQARQEILLGKLIEKDALLHTLEGLDASDIKTIRKGIDRKIDLFQKLNADFVEKISSVHGLIRFDKKKNKVT